MTVHFPPAVDELLDCRYEWCGRTGAHGFKREDNRKEHYRMVHNREDGYPKRGKQILGRRSIGNPNTPGHSNPIAVRQTAEEGVPASGTPHDSKLSTTVVAQLKTQDAKVKAGDLDSQSFRLSDWTATASDDVGIGSFEAFGVGLAIDHEIKREHINKAIHTDLGAYIEWQTSMRKSKFGADWHSASLNLEWDVSTFLKDQFCDPNFPNISLGPIVTISGSAQRAQATTCSQYIQQNWPAHGSRLLDTLQDALQSPSRTSKSRLGEHDSYAELEFNVVQKNVGLNIKAKTSEVIVDVVQQFSWMGAALRTSTNGRVQYCETKLTEGSQAGGNETVAIDITFHLTSPAENDQSCWFRLFKNPVIAHRFPTADRSDCDVGLEIPLDIMAALGGARHAVDFEGGLVLKGYSTLFVPIGRHEDSVQWHLTCAEGDDRIAYCEASAQYPNRALLEDINHDDLRTTRAFLGWCKEAEVHLATADTDYESIDWSKATEAGQSLKLTGGSLGVSKLITAQVNFVLGAKDGSFHHSQPEPFQRTIDRAERLPVLLYD